MRSHYEEQLKKMQSRLDQTAGRLEAVKEKAAADVLAAEERHNDDVAAAEASAVHAAAEREERLQAGARANHARCVIVIDTLFQASFLELNGSL